ncbi:hypothetical protein ACJX0J_015731 [Zea mays]
MSKGSRSLNFQMHPCLTMSTTSSCFVTFWHSGWNLAGSQVHTTSHIQRCRGALATPTAWLNRLKIEIFVFFLCILEFINLELKGIKSDNKNNCLAALKPLLIYMTLDKKIQYFAILSNKLSAAMHKKFNRQMAYHLTHDTIMLIRIGVPCFIISKLLRFDLTFTPSISKIQIWNDLCLAFTPSIYKNDISIYGSTLFGAWILFIHILSVSFLVLFTSFVFSLFKINLDGFPKVLAAVRKRREKQNVSASLASLLLPFGTNMI